ncbi:MAG: helix-turn-helix domain-containing protein [Candidatus Sericytochromatia bacterium]
MSSPCPGGPWKRACTRKNDIKFGRPAKLTGERAALARRMKANGETAATICQTLGIGRTTLYRYLGESDEE